MSLKIKQSNATTTLAELADVSKWVYSSTTGVTAFSPGTIYYLGTITSLTYTLSGATNGCEWRFCFKTGSTAPTITHPSGVKIGDLKIQANKWVEINIVQWGGSKYLAWKDWPV